MLLLSGFLEFKVAIRKKTKSKWCDRKNRSRRLW